MVTVVAEQDLERARSHREGVDRTGGLKVAVTNQLFLLLRDLLGVELEAVDDGHVDLDLLRLAGGEGRLQLDLPGGHTGRPQAHLLDAQVRLVTRSDLKRVAR